MGNLKFRDLTPGDVDVRIGQIGDGYFTLLLYKDARVDMDILDESVGAGKWQRRHYEVKGNLFCEIGIAFDDFGWVFKSDCGTESNTEKEKGEASDSFKRACVNWGIGRELYTAPKIFIKCGCKKGDKFVPYKNFIVTEMSVASKSITALTISAYNTDKKITEIVFKSGKTTTDEHKPTEKREAVKPKEISKAQEIAALIKGTKITGNDIAAKVKADFGKEKVNELTDSEFALFYEQIERCVSESENNRR